MSDNFANPLQEAKSDVAKAAESISGLLNPQEQAKTEDVKETKQENTEEQKVQEQETQESPKTEEQPEVQEQKSETEPEVEVSDEEEVSQQDAPEIQQEQNSTYKVKVAGQEFDVTLDELKAGYSRDSDYRRKTEELSYDKRLFQSETEKQRQNFSKKLGDLNQLMSVAQQQLDSEMNSQNLEKLYEEDPVEATRIEHRLRRKQDAFNQAIQKAKSIQQREIQNFVKDQQKELVSKVPDFNDPQKASAIKNNMRNYLSGYGFNDEEIGQIYDHRIVMLVNDAMKYRSLESKKPNIAKKIAKPSKVFTSGVKKTKESLSANKFKDKLSRLRKTGSIKDAQSVFLDVIGNN